MSIKEWEVKNCIFKATGSLKSARAALKAAMENFKRCEVNLLKENRQEIGLNVDGIETVLNAADDYILKAIGTLDEKGGAV